MQRYLPLFLLAGALASAQTVRPIFSAFEVATIKPLSDDDAKAGRFIRMQSAHTFEAKNYTTDGLIAAAYDLPPAAISGGPKWAESDRYEILASTPGESVRPTYDEQMAMLQKLLADRFHLTFHREKKEFSLYELTIAKGGPKLAETASTFDEPSNVTSTVYPAKSGGIDRIMMPARNVTMHQFASVLQRAILDRPVVDHTELTARYDFDLEWTPDDSQFGGTLPKGAPDTEKPPLFTAMRDKLGLRLEAKRGPLDVLVIDRLDRPSED